MYKTLIGIFIIVFYTSDVFGAVCGFEVEDGIGENGVNLFGLIARNDPTASFIRKRIEGVIAVPVIDDTNRPELTAQLEEILIDIENQKVIASQMNGLMKRFDLPPAETVGLEFQYNFNQQYACLARIVGEYQLFITPVIELYQHAWRRVHTYSRLPEGVKGRLSDYAFSKLAPYDNCVIEPNRWQEADVKGFPLAKDTKIDKAHYLMGVEKDIDVELGVEFYRHAVFVAASLPSFKKRFYGSFEQMEAAEACKYRVNPESFEQVVFSDRMDVKASVKVTYLACTEHKRFQCGLKFRGLRVYRKYCEIEPMTIDVFTFTPRMNLATLQIGKTVVGGRYLKLKQKEFDMNAKFYGPTSENIVLTDEEARDFINEKLDDEVANYLSYRLGAMFFVEDADTGDVMIVFKVQSKSLKKSEICEVDKHMSGLSL